MLGPVVPKNMSAGLKKAPSVCETLDTESTRKIKMSDKLKPQLTFHANVEISCPLKQLIDKPYLKPPHMPVLKYCILIRY